MWLFLYYYIRRDKTFSRPPLEETSPRTANKNRADKINSVNFLYIALAGQAFFLLAPKKNQKRAII
jgi:hypothetical protein